MAAREGRAMQRYSPTGAREVGVGIVFALRDGGVLHVAAVSCRKHPQRLTFPKGGWESDETVEECAARESFEEAGLRTAPLVLASGVQAPVVPIPSMGKATALNLYPVVLALVEEVEVFPEQAERTRSWLVAADVVAGRIANLKPEFTALLQREASDVGLPAVIRRMSQHAASR